MNANSVLRSQVWTALVCAAVSSGTSVASANTYSQAWYAYGVATTAKGSMTAQKHAAQQAIADCEDQQIQDEFDDHFSMGEQSERSANLLAQLGTLYFNMRRYTEAKQFFEHAKTHYEMAEQEFSEAETVAESCPSCP